MFVFIKISSDEEESFVVAQASSIGSLGHSYESWIANFVDSMSGSQNKRQTANPEFKLIFPTMDDYKNSYKTNEAGCPLNYKMDNHKKQAWITKYMQ